MNAEIIPHDASAQAIQPSQGPGLLETATTGISAYEVETRAMIETRAIIAMRKPRSIGTFKARALDMVKLDRETADSCFYSLKRSGKAIEGPSVRLAEIAFAAYQHLDAGGRVIGFTDDQVVAMGYCYDLENNVRVVTEVRRRITDRNGNRYSEDMLAVTGNAAIAIARRNAILQMIPRAYTDPLWQAAQKVAAGNITTLSDGRNRAVEKCVELGISKPRMLAALERESLDDVTIADLVMLQGILTAIADGETTVAKEFPDPDAQAAEKLATAADLAKELKKEGDAANAEAKRTATPGNTGAFITPGQFTALVKLQSEAGVDDDALTGYVRDLCGATPEKMPQARLDEVRAWLEERKGAQS